MLKVENVTKSFGGKKVLENINFEIEIGKTVSIIGPSGSGKSTLLRTIGQLEKIDSGNIIVNSIPMLVSAKNGKMVYNKKDNLHEINLNCGMVFQDFNLFPHLNVIENIVLPQTTVLKRGKKAAEQCAKELLKKMNLTEKEKSYPFELSGGQKQRVSIARMLAMNPKLLLFDEPTSALDPELTDEVLKVIKLLASEKKCAILIVTHEISFAKEISDEIIFMENGRIITKGDTQELEKSNNKRLKRYLS